MRSTREAGVAGIGDVLTTRNALPRLNADRVELQMRVDGVRAVVVHDLDEVRLVLAGWREIAAIEAVRDVDHHALACRVDGAAFGHRDVDGIAARRVDVR